MISINLDDFLHNLHNFKPKLTRKFFKHFYKSTIPFYINRYIFISVMLFSQRAHFLDFDLNENMDILSKIRKFCNLKANARLSMIKASNHH